VTPAPRRGFVLWAPPVRAAPLPYFRRMPDAPRLLLADDPHRAGLYPLTATRPCAGLRVGIDTLAGRWTRLSGLAAGVHVPHVLRPAFPPEAAPGALVANGRLLPDAELAAAVLALAPGTGLAAEDGSPLAWRCAPGAAPAEDADGHAVPEGIRLEAWTGGPVRWLARPWDLFLRNAEALAEDFAGRTAGRASAPLAPDNTVIGEHPVFLEPGAEARGALFDTRNGPVYLDRDAEVMPGCLVRGPVALGRGAVLKMGAKIYGATTIGPGCKVGGEVNNSILQAHSNKAHDGFLGNSVLGAWCNLGADTNNSNLKNDYGPVRVWDEASGAFADSGLQFCGLFMGDHSKAGINTMFNTGTVVGVSANVFGGGFPPKRIPDFAWGGAEGLVPYRLDKALATADRVLARRGLALSEGERAVLAALHARSLQTAF
jgi:UDP-N-acetylglucosamine diphosphorylase/glucosamine-1-phosphate N-acetyltransferase